MHHGEKLQQRFQLAAYKLMNRLLKTIDITRKGEEAFVRLAESDTHIHIVGGGLRSLFYSRGKQGDLQAFGPDKAECHLWGNQLPAWARCLFDRV